MPDADLADALTEAAQRLISASPNGDVEGRDVALEIGRDPADPDASLHHAFNEIKRRGTLECFAFEGGMGLPGIVRLPPAR